MTDKELNTGEPVAIVRKNETGNIWLEFQNDKQIYDFIGTKFYSQDYVNQLFLEIAELKHMNRNWQISEAQLLEEIEAFKKGDEATALLNYNKGHEDGRKLAIPSPVKELTDIDIKNCKVYARNEFQKMITPQSVPIQQEILDRLFANAILRKAQEK